MTEPIPRWTRDDQARVRNPHTPPRVPEPPLPAVLVPPRQSDKSMRWRRRVATLLARDGSDCWLCGRRLGGDITLDHVIPRSKGGGSALHNLRLAHKPCNNRRGSDDAISDADDAGSEASEDAPDAPRR